MDEAALRLKKAPFEDLGYAKVDLHRAVRQGAAEVIYGAGKTPAQIAGIAARMRERGVEPILITRLSPEAAAKVKKTVPLDYRAEAKLGIVGKIPEPVGPGTVVVATGGTSDIPVAEEAAVTAEVHGSRVVRLYDVGVSGLHRLLAHADELVAARAVVAVARDGGCAGQRGRRTGRLPGHRRADERWLRARASAAWPRCSRCSIPAQAASAS